MLHARQHTTLPVQPGGVKVAAKTDTYESSTHSSLLILYPLSSPNHTWSAQGRTNLLHRSRQARLAQGLSQASRWPKQAFLGAEAPTLQSKSTAPYEDFSERASLGGIHRQLLMFAEQAVMLPKAPHKKVNSSNWFMIVIFVCKHRGVCLGTCFTQAARLNVPEEAATSVTPFACVCVCVVVCVCVCVCEVMSKATGPVRKHLHRQFLLVSTQALNISINAKVC